MNMDTRKKSVKELLKIQKNLMINLLASINFFEKKLSPYLEDYGNEEKIYKSDFKILPTPFILEELTEHNNRLLEILKKLENIKHRLLL